MQSVLIYDFAVYLRWSKTLHIHQKNSPTTSAELKITDYATVLSARLGNWFDW